MSTPASLDGSFPTTSNANAQRRSPLVNNNLPSLPSPAPSTTAGVSGALPATISHKTITDLVESHGQQSENRDSLVKDEREVCKKNGVQDSSPSPSRSVDTSGPRVSSLGTLPARCDGVVDGQRSVPLEIIESKETVEEFEGLKLRLGVEALRVRAEWERDEALMETDDLETRAWSTALQRVAGLKEMLDKAQVLKHQALNVSLEGK
ncbi:hypothetical protein BDY24DRAFT_71177 [Mrakia frigida]|uniref:uncharacterized protein n=1 Tax=Mrakia frigida TaxID=29902 RepID=UPI003FCBFA59